LTVATRRQIALAEARVAGYNGDTGRHWLRLLVESRVSRADMLAAWAAGARAREAERRAPPAGGYARNPALTAARRRRLPRSAFALPDVRAYPVDTRGRAVAAKGRALQALEAGRLSRAEYARVVEAADARLGRNPISPLMLGAGVGVSAGLAADELRAVRHKLTGRSGAFLGRNNPRKDRRGFDAYTPDLFGGAHRERGEGRTRAEQMELARQEMRDTGSRSMFELFDDDKSKKREKSNPSGRDGLLLLALAAVAAYALSHWQHGAGASPGGLPSVGHPPPPPPQGFDIPPWQRGADGRMLWWPGQSYQPLPSVGILPPPPARGYDIPPWQRGAGEFRALANVSVNPPQLSHPRSFWALGSSTG
jgi:hypothetical protein